VIVGYAHASAGYVPTVAALTEGGYEVSSSPFGAVAIERAVGWATVLTQELDRARAAAAAASRGPTESPAPVPELIVPRHCPERAKFPVIDCHLHYFSLWCPVEEVMARFDALNVRAGISLVGDVFPGAALEPVLDIFGGRVPARLRLFGGLDFSRIDDSDWPDYVRSKLDHDVALGASGLKVYKELGLRHRDRLGNLILPDDPRLDPVWAALAERGLPVVYHIADPVPFFAPLDDRNERREQLASLDSKWWWGGPGFPTHERLMQSLQRLASRQPRTTFIFPHLAWLPHDLARCGQLLDRFANVHLDISATLDVLARQPYTAREFFCAYADRLLFGTDDMIPNWKGGYPAWFRFLETADQYYFEETFGRPTRWPCYGLHLPDDVLRKVYGTNASARFGIALE
jgi:hypothetical protein